MTRIERAKMFLRLQFQNGNLTSIDGSAATREAMRRDITTVTLWRARKELGVDSQRVGFGPGSWFQWTWNGEPREARNKPAKTRQRPSPHPRPHLRQASEGGEHGGENGRFPHPRPHPHQVFEVGEHAGEDGESCTCQQRSAATNYLSNQHLRSHRPDAPEPAGLARARVRNIHYIQYKKKIYLEDARVGSNLRASSRPVRWISLLGQAVEIFFDSDPQLEQLMREWGFSRSSDRGVWWAFLDEVCSEQFQLLRVHYGFEWR